MNVHGPGVSKGGRMRKLGLATLVALVGLVALYVGGPGSAGSHKHKVKADTLIGYQETPGIASTATGTFSAEIDDDAQVITFTETFVGLTGPALFSHVHFGNRFDAG